MTNISMVSHIGTYIKVPYHIFPEGQDLSAMPVESFCGPAVLLDFSDIQQRIEISEERVIKAAEAAGGIKEGDIVLCNLGYADRYGSDAKAPAQSIFSNH